MALETDQYLTELEELVSQPFDPVSFKGFIKGHAGMLDEEFVTTYLAKEDEDPVLLRAYEIIKERYEQGSE